MRYLITILLFFSFLNAQEFLNSTKKELLKKELKKSIEESKLQKDSWIKELYIEATTSNTKSADTNNETKSNIISINLEQEIFKSGAILNTIKKGKNLEKLSYLEHLKQKQLLLWQVYEYVIYLKKLDIQKEKLNFLILNKNIQINKKQQLYKNGLADISELDESVIELSNLKNDLENLNIEKSKLLKEFINYSNKNYKQISLNILVKIPYESYIKNNLNINSQRLNIKDTNYDKKITTSSYLPKLSVYGQYGYDDTQEQKRDDFYTYGLKLNIPLDYNYKKNITISKLKEKIENLKMQELKVDEKAFYEQSSKQLEYINKKIKNSKEILKRYQNIYSLVEDMYKNFLKTKDDVDTIKNSIEVVKLDIKLLKLDKKNIFNGMFKNSSVGE